MGGTRDTPDFEHPHRGPVHDIRTKEELSKHVKTWHQKPNGQFTRSTRATPKWRRDELEFTHRAFHELNEEKKET